MSVPARQDNMHHFGFVAKTLDYLDRIEHAIADGIVDFVEDDQVPGPRLDRLLGFRPRFFDHAHIFGIGLLCAYFHEAATHLLHHELVAESLDGIEFPVVPRSLQELKHQHPHTLADGAQGCSHGGGSVALAGAGIYDDESTADIRHRRRNSYCTCWR